jgi:hypothetical protein
MGWWASTAGTALLPRHMHRARFMRGVLIITVMMDVMVRSINAQGEWVKRTCIWPDSGCLPPLQL